MQSIAKYLCNYSKAMTSNGKQLSIVKYSYVLVHVKVVQTNIAKYPKYLNCWISYPLLISAVLRERRRYQIGWIFGKFPKGEGSFSIQKFMLQILRTLNRAFLSWNWNKIVISGFRVCSFNNCIKKIKTWHTDHHTSLHICNHIYHKNLPLNFPKMRGRGGQRPFGIFPKIHPIW